MFFSFGWIYSLVYSINTGNNGLPFHNDASDTKILLCIYIIIGQFISIFKNENKNMKIKI